eukprot:11189538-Lingulodinium_polyedra.AAC.1
MMLDFNGIHNPLLPTLKNFNTRVSCLYRCLEGDDPRIELLQSSARAPELSGRVLELRHTQCFKPFKSLSLGFDRNGASLSRVNTNGLFNGRWGSGRLGFAHR